MTDPALAHWLDEHRQHLTERIFHLMYVLQTLHDHDEHTLHAILTERTAIAQAAAVVVEHLRDTDLAGTHLWLAYAGVARDPAQQWRERYAAAGAEGLREWTVEDLEAAARELAHPTAHAAGVPTNEETTWIWYENVSEHLLVLLHQLREELAALRHDPRSAEHRTAAENLLAELTESTGRTAEHLENLATGKGFSDGPNSSRVKGVRDFMWASVAVGPYRRMAQDFAVASVDHAAPLEEASWHATAAVNTFLGR